MQSVLCSLASPPGPTCSSPSGAAAGAPGLPRLCLEGAECSVLYMTVGDHTTPPSGVIAVSAAQRDHKGLKVRELTRHRCSVSENSWVGCRYAGRGTEGSCRQALQLSTTTAPWSPGIQTTCLGPKGQPGLQRGQGTSPKLLIWTASASAIKTQGGFVTVIYYSSKIQV